MRNILPDLFPFISPRNKTMKSTLYDGFNFDSEKELYRYKKLKELRKQHKIRHLGIHPRFLVLNEFTYNKNRVSKPIYYEPSFAYEEKGIKIVEDLKGYVNEAHEIKKKLFLFKFRDVEYREPLSYT